MNGAQASCLWGNRASRLDEARKAFDRAASLTDDPALREYLLQRSAEDVGEPG
jgi:predicted RNA polymerase sigma factor